MVKPQPHKLQYMVRPQPLFFRVQQNGISLDDVEYLVTLLLRQVTKVQLASHRYKHWTNFCNLRNLIHNLAYI